MGDRIMRASEFVVEGTPGRKGKLRTSTANAMHKTHAFGDGYKTNGTYNFYRVGLAAAMADGSDKKLDIDDRTWYATNNVAVPYTEEEHDMLHQAFNSINTNVESVVSDHRSKEADTVNKQSITAKPKRNKYGV
jgi:hypothetical protein